MEINIDGKLIGENHPLFFIAEAGVNHNGSLKLGKQLIDCAADAGADAVKFQTFNTEEIITPNAPKSTYHIETTGDDSKQSWYELLKSQELTKEMHLELIAHSKKRNILFLSTPYDEKSVDLLNDLGVPLFKIASTDNANLNFLKYVAKTKRPMIVSTAMANSEEVDDLVECIKANSCNEFALLQCTGNYPSKLENSNLRVMKTYREKYQCVVGFSDHTLGFINPVAATAMGASIYEKHFTIDTSLPGPDHRMSLDPEGLKKTITMVRETEKAMGSHAKRLLSSEKENRQKLKKSLVANIDIKVGSVINKKMIGIKRPGNGLPPKMLRSIIGKKSKVDINKGAIILKNMLSG